MSHPFGELLTQYRLRVSGLTQNQLAELAGYDKSLLARMCKGGKDLTGPSGRDRVLRLVGILRDAGALHMRDEANSLLFVAQMPPLFDAQPAEAALLKCLEVSKGPQARKTNLPPPLSSFLGRAAEVAAIVDVLATTRLLTLTGAGGSGKTRLAQVVAGAQLPAFPDGVWYVELASVVDGSNIESVIASVLGAVTGTNPSARETVIRQLRQLHALLVLDNCEHVIDAAADLVAELLRNCPRLTVLATSREALNIDGETTRRVPALQLDEAVALFSERSRARQHHASAEQLPLVAEICLRLDRMPLAIELAAAHVDTLSLEVLIARLDDRFALLKQPRRATLPRHQTLRAVMDWSYALLSSDEQQLFCQLSIFVGGWTLALAEDLVVELDGPHEGVLPLLMQLTAKSLIQIEQHDGEMRYTMLETMRQYGAERLQQESADGIARLQAAHSRAIERWVEQMHQLLIASFTRKLLMRVDRNYPNVHAVLSRSFSTGGDSELAIRIVSRFALYWYAELHRDDRDHFIAQAEQATTPTTPPIMRAMLVLIRCGTRYYSHHEDLEQLAQAITVFEQAREHVRAASARATLAFWQFCEQGFDESHIDTQRRAIVQLQQADSHTLSRIYIYILVYALELLGKFDEACELLEKTAMECRAAGEDFHLSRLLFLHAHISLERLAFARALVLLQEAERIAHHAPDPVFELRARILIAESLRFLGDPAQAAVIAAECLAYTQKYLGDMNDEVCILVLTKSLTDCNRFEEAHGYTCGLVKRVYNTRVEAAVHYFLKFDAIARNASAAGRAAEAAYLYGAADADIERTKQRRFLHNDLEHAPLIERAKEALGEAGYQQQHAAGRAATLEQAVQFALTFW